MSDAFQLVAGHLALDFANTLDNRYDPERRIELLLSYERFLQFVRQSGVITRQEAAKLLTRTKPAQAARALERIVELRETLHDLFVSVSQGQPPPPDALKALNRFISEMAIPRIIAWKEPDFVWRRPVLTEAPLDPLRPILEAAAGLLTSPDRVHVRQCSAPACRWLFLDHSKNHSRLWCDMNICGNRAKAQRHQARLRGAR